MFNVNLVRWNRIESRITQYVAEGDFEFAGPGRFVIRPTKTIGKPWALVFVSRHGGGEQFLGAFATVSGAKNRAKRFGAWSN